MKRILIADGNEDSRYIYELYLEFHGYAVLEAHDGHDALRVARQERPGLLLVRKGLPRLDGWEVARILKSDPGTADIPIIGYSANAMAEVREGALEAGCDRFMLGPVAPRAFEAAIRELIGGPRAD